MATNVWKILKSTVLGNRPTGRAYGEPYVNFAELQFGIIGSGGGAQDLIGVPIFSASASYTTGNPVNHSGLLYLATTSVSPGAWNPAQWVQVGGTSLKTIKVQRFLSSGTYTPSAGLIYAIVECGGGGGGGGGINSSSGVGYVISAGGGGGGAYSRSAVSAGSIGVSQTVTVGGGGTGSFGATNAGNGSTTSFGSLVTAVGGGGAVGSSVAVLGSPGGGGASGTGQVVIQGSPGMAGNYMSLGSGGAVFVSVGGMGGASMFGGPSIQVAVGNGGVSAGVSAPANSGAGGGGGAFANCNSSALSGGNGGSGLCVVTEFCTQ
jgi:hypothetical protein